MDLDATVDIKHAIFNIREAQLGNDQYLEGDILPKRSLQSKIDVIQHELTNIIQCLGSLDYTSQSRSMGPRSRSLIIHRFIAFHAKLSVMVVHCAINHSRHDIFWTSPDMALSVRLIMKQTRISSQCFVSLLNAKRVIFGDIPLASLPGLGEFYSVMHQLGSLLFDLSDGQTIDRSNADDEATEALADFSDTWLWDIEPLARNWGAPGCRGSSTPAAGETCDTDGGTRNCALPRAHVSSHGPDTGIHANASRAASGVSPSVVSLYIAPTKKGNDGQGPDFIIDFKYDLPVRPQTPTRKESFEWPPELAWPPTPSKPSRRRRHRRPCKPHALSTDCAAIKPEILNHSDLGDQYCRSK